MKKKVIVYTSIVVIVLMFIAGIISVRTYVYPIKYKDQILNYAGKYNIDPYLVFAIINVESRFNKNAVSSRNAKGLMQIIDSTAEEINNITNSTDILNDDTLYNEDINIELGCKYLASLISRYKGNYYLAICSYNAGIGNVNKWIEQNIVTPTLDTININLPFNETSKYLKKVISNYKTYKLLYPSLG